jgi:hypothetical protein
VCYNPDSLWQTTNDVRVLSLRRRLDVAAATKNIQSADTEDSTDDAVKRDADENLTTRLGAWLDDVGLDFHPFSPETLDASNDARLSTYLVSHDDFAAAWGDWVSTILAPAGGGKSAFRVRLAYAARVAEDGRRIFPVVYPLPRAVTSLETYLETLTRAAAYELLLGMVYRPGRFEALKDGDQRLVRRALDHNAPGWERFLPQLERAGGPAPLIETFDRSAARLPNSPDPRRVQALCATLREMRSDSHRPPAAERWRQLTDLLLNTLQMESVYVFIDGVDAYPETVHDPHLALAWLGPLLDQASTWADSRIFLKLFLPIELYDALWQTRPHLLTFPSKFAKIIWTPERLAEVLAARLRIASQGEYDSLDALFTPALRDIHRKLVDAARPAVPREVLVLAGRVLIEHVRRPAAGDLLEPQDLEAAKEWYRSDRSIVSSP